MPVVRFFALCFLSLAMGGNVFGQSSCPNESCQSILPEQRCLDIRRPGQFAQVAVPVTPKPATVSDPQFDVPVRELTLNEAINTALANSEVVRVLTGFTASTSGRTIYDTSIANTAIDVARGTFDPALRANNTWRRDENPSAIGNSIIRDQREDYTLDFGLSQRNLLGGTASFDVAATSESVDSPFAPSLNPSDRTTTSLGYRQPLLRGAGKAANQAPIVLARIDTERSFFQYKAAVQSSVRGIIEAYWSLVSAKTDLWAREQQVEQAEFANNRTLGRIEVGDASAGDLAQTQLALESFRAQLLASRANVLQQQAALLNILGLPPYESTRTVPTTPMTTERVAVDWAAINELAQRQRPDIIELKLILEADQQSLLIANNNARPQLDGQASYRWNGLEGVTPAGNRIGSQAGDFDGFTLGVNFSVPLGMRADRAALRARRLLIQRDRANLDQGLHQMQHNLALSIRNLDQFYEQHQRFQAVRRAARDNLEQQLAQYSEGLVQFIVVLQAIVDWGNSVGSEAQALTQYNTAIAQLELETGTLLESHDIVFFEERFTAIGPLGRLGETACYPRSQPPTPTVSRYEDGDQPSEEYFGLEDPAAGRAGLLEEDGEEMTGEVNDEGLDQEVEFEKLDEDDDGELSDEEINNLLEGRQARRKLSDFLRLPFTR